MKTARQNQKEQTRELLIQTAYDLFSKNGILSTRMSDIAQAAGVSHGTVFLHFKTQETLIAAVTEIYCGRIAAQTHELAESAGSLQELLSAHLRGIMEYEPFYTRLVNENRLLPPAARDAWITMQSALSFHFSKAAVQPEQAGVPPDFLFNIWVGLIHYYLANGDLFAPEGNVIRRYGEYLIENYMKMIRNIGE